MRCIERASRQMQIEIAKMFWHQWIQGRNRIEINQSQSEKDDQSGIRESNRHTSNVCVKNSTRACVRKPAFNTSVDMVRSARSARSDSSSHASARVPPPSITSAHTLSECYKRPENMSFDVSLMQKFGMNTLPKHQQLSSTISQSQTSSFQNLIREIPRIRMARTKQTERKAEVTVVAMMIVVLRSIVAGTQPNHHQFEDDEEGHLHRQNMAASSVRK